MSGLPENQGSRSRVPEGLVRTSLRHPWGVVLAWLALAALLTPGLTELQIETSTDSVLDRSHPEWSVYQETQDQFGNDELLVIALRSDRPLDPVSLELVVTLTEELEGIEGIRRVDSLSTVPAIGVNAEGTIDLTPSLEGGPDEPEALRRYVENRLAADRIAPGSLISDDGKTLAINILLQRGQEDRHKEILDKIRHLTSTTSASLSGVPVFRVVASEKTSSEILRFVPITALLIAIMVGILFRSILAVGLSLLPGLLASWLLLGIMGYTGAPLSITTMVLPSVILALGCAYAMHALVAASAAGTQDPDGRIDSEKLASALFSVSLPVALSGLTTTVGFLSMSLLRIEAVHATGLYGAIGVLAVTLLTLTLVPALLSVSKKLWPDPPFFKQKHSIAAWFTDFAQQKRGVIFLVWTGFSVLALMGLWRIQVETDATRWLPPGHEVRDSYEEIREQLSGISPMNVVITAPPGQSVLEPHVLEAIDALCQNLEAREDVGQTLAITDPLRQMGGSMRDDAGQPLPGSIAEAEQFLMILESMDHIDDLLSSDRNSANILIRADNNASADLRKIAIDIQSWWQTNGPAGYSAQTTGIMYEFARAQDEITFGQIRGLAVALVVISMILFFIFRWPAMALATIIPNLIPLFMIFGFLGLVGLPLDAGTVLIGCLALVFAVDDTIHIAIRFTALSRSGAAPPVALKEALSSVLPAIVSTTLVIGIGFAVIGLSEFTITRNLGLLTTAIMSLCLIADLTLFPALLVRLNPREASLVAAPRGD
ncbi:MAG: MMPL family transporter [Myxococcota bacterium]|nr:MMPL family transporter [Myxococcota bacterium]